MRRFTLIELTVVLAVVAVLAAIAIPQYALAKLRTERAELFVNVDGIAVAEAGFHAANDQYAVVGVEEQCSPAGWPGRSARPWIAVVPFTELGWAPTGAVYGSYSVTDATQSIDRADCATGHCSFVEGFCAWGSTDLDLDRRPSMVWATNAARAEFAAPGFEDRY